MRISPNLLQRIALSVDDKPTAIVAGPRTGKTIAAAMLANRAITRDQGDFVYVAPDRHQADYFTSTLQGMAGRAVGPIRSCGGGTRQAKYGTHHMIHSFGQASLSNFFHCDYHVNCLVVDNAETLEEHSQEIIAAIGLRFKCRTILFGTLTATLSGGSIVVPERPFWSIRDGWDYVLLAKGVYQCP